MGAFWVSVSFFIWVMILGTLLGWGLLSMPPRYLKYFSPAKIISLPALVLAPIVLIAGKIIFQVNLIFPMQIGSSPLQLFVSLLVPSLVLLVCSGLGQGIYLHMSQLWDIWSEKQCALVSRSLGLSVTKQFRPLILFYGSLKAWSQALPWLFGELIVIECMFNAPGVGYALWNSAKQRDVLGLWTNLSLILATYIVFYSLNRIAGGWLGRRLENYN